MPYQSKITPKKKKEFIRLLSETGNVTKCCEALKIDRKGIYTHKRNNKKFAKEWEEARDLYVALLEDEAWRRAFKGIDKPVWYKGKMVGVEKRYSDTLLMFKLQAERPDKYQYRQKIDAKVNGNITVKVVKFADGNKDTK